MTTEKNSVSPLSSQFVLLMAMACGLCAGSAYFNQPLIYSIEESLGITTSQAGLTVVIAQIGYVLGLMLLVPLGDFLNKRKLILSLMVFAAISQILLSFSTTLSTLYVFTLCATFGAISAQVLIPFASTISPPESSAAIVGKLMSGLVMGIILSRTFAGFVSTYWSWEGVYLSSGIITLLFAILMWKKLPNTQPQAGLTIGDIYRSLFIIAKQNPHLIRRACAGALGFGILSMIFTSMTFVLGSAPYHFTDFDWPVRLIRDHRNLFIKLVRQNRRTRQRKSGRQAMYCFNTRLYTALIFCPAEYCDLCNWRIDGLFWSDRIPCIKSESGLSD